MYVDWKLSWSFPANFHKYHFVKLFVDPSVLVILFPPLEDKIEILPVSVLFAPAAWLNYSYILVNHRSSCLRFTL